jgi:RNA polymerase sigma factor (sigma-70 family)
MPIQITETANLLARIQHGDREAERIVLQEYQRAILRIATVRTRDAEVGKDLCQEILIAVLKALRAGGLREQEKLSAFIQGVARNVINNYFRCKVRRAEDDLTDVEEKLADPSNAVERFENDERRLLFRRELARCSMVDQKILLLSLVDGKALTEVANEMGISYEAVRTRKSRAVRRLTCKFASASREAARKAKSLDVMAEAANQELEAAFV